MTVGPDVIVALGIALLALLGSTLWLAYRLARRRPKASAESDIAEGFLQQAFRSFPLVAMITRVEDGQIVEVNDSFVQSTGYARDEIIGTSVLRLWEQPEQRNRMIRLVKQTGKLAEFECRAIMKSGAVRHCQVSAQVVELDGEQHLMSIVQDVTEMRELQREVLRTADNERQQLANELHDGLAQDLAGVSYLMRSLEQALENTPERPRSQIKQLREVIETAIEKARAIARGVSPVEISQGGLAVALYRLRLDIATIYEVEMRVDFHASVQLNESASVGVYAIVHEAVMNAAKHSNCAHIDVGLDVNANGMLEVIIKDDGTGMTSPAGPAGMGIRLMKHRAALLGGRLNIRSTPGSGTAIECHFDFQATAPADRLKRMHLI